MKKELNDILACPICKSDLMLTINLEENNDVIEGELMCQSKACNLKFPIKDGIPNLLPPK